MDGVKLIVLTALKGVPRPNNKLMLTRKFIDGISLFKELWKGPITLMCEPAQSPSANLDNLEINPSSMPFDVVCGEFNETKLIEQMSGKCVILSPVGMQFNGVSSVAARQNVPSVYISEYSLQTRLQIVREYKKSPLHIWWSSRWERNQEKAQTRGLLLASGVQCNGTPTFDQYRSLTPNALLFFDTRMTKSLMASNELIDRKYSDLGKRPLRLLFSGRLTKMKGVDDIPRIASELKKRNIQYTFTVCGAGECAGEMKEIAKRLGVSSTLIFKGILDFERELIPLVSKEVDLFVCCHRQGDPSCTYLETMGCGVPIVGYRNEAFRGLSEAAAVGWTVSQQTPAAMADRIIQLVSQPDELNLAAKKSLEFARRNDFETTFKKRIDHLNQVVAFAGR